MIAFDPREGPGKDVPKGDPPPIGKESVRAALAQDVLPANYGGTSTVPRVGVKVGGHFLKVGTRVRESIAWHACALQNTGVAPAAVAVDYDLFLYNKTTGKFVAASQSLDDNNEGYDHVISGSDGDGDYETWVVAVPGTPCGGAATEPFAYTFIDFTSP